MVLDFGQNIAVKFQREIKSVHWAKTQITIHPIVCYYLDQAGHLTRESLVMLSNDLDHDHHAVQCFVEIAVKHLQSVRKLKIEQLHEWMDGCPSQYKCKEGVSDISHAQSDFGFPRYQNYFGSEHGKGESDGVTGNMKSTLEMAILGEKVVIRNADDCYDYCVKHLQKETSTDNNDEAYVKSLR